MGVADKDGSLLCWNVEGKSGVMLGKLSMAGREGVEAVNVE